MPHPPACQSLRITWALCFPALSSGEPDLEVWVGPKNLVLFVCYCFQREEGRRDGNISNENHL